MVEIVVSMLLIAVIAISFLPILVNSLKNTALNITISAGTQYANDQLDAGNNRIVDCAGLDDFVAETPPAIIDSQGVTLQAVRTKGTCDDKELSTAALTITVSREDTTTVVATVTTLLGVKAPPPAPSPSPSPNPSAGG